MAHGVLALLVCVAINACPPLAAELQLLAAAEAGDQRRVLDVLAARGGERFGERDNADELGVLEQWLQAVLGRRGPGIASALAAAPSVHGLLEAVLGPQRSAGWAMGHLDLGPGAEHHTLHTALQQDLARCWAASQPARSNPPLVLVKGQIPVPVLCSAAAVDLGGCLDAAARQQLQGARAAAQREAAAGEAVARSIGAQASSCAEIAQALADLRSWLGRDLGALGSQSCEAVRRHLETHAAVWQAVVGRVGERQQRARQAKRDAERGHTYVLRAFVVRDAPSDQQQQHCFSVVRRFGKAWQPGHLSVLGADGVCRPTRVQDVAGVAVESMWVCCTDDAECLAGGPDAAEGAQGGGINTVVADPDDDIYCRVCGYLDSQSYDQIVICDGCELGVHQMCHEPVVTEDDLVRDTWHCAACRAGPDPAKRPRTG
ncbi:hypothetical protein H4R18_001472 [Coemansia javaensis]|uniref:PHD-type domain-containing protein n=1 Tax=Coemansia javaensis TaxID=2761396 RepID=A0A9W8HEY6_9FUNG|nr:hypothetical protein H4R18_001472 [Coemansia javaensis]